jgi:hypothetical protein
MTMHSVNIKLEGWDVCADYDLSAAVGGLGRAELVEFNDQFGASLIQAR